MVSIKNVTLVAIYPKQLRFLLGSSLQQTSAPPCGALDRFRKFGWGKTRNKRTIFTRFFTWCFTYILLVVINPNLVKSSLSQVVTWPAATRVLSLSERENPENEVVKRILAESTLQNSKSSENCKQSLARCSRDLHFTGSRK